MFTSTYKDRVEIPWWLAATENRDIYPVSVLLPPLKGKQKRAVTDFQYPAIFPSEFSVLPQKISENLRADSASDANSREIRVLYKPLNIKHLHTRGIFLSSKTHYFSTWYGPFHGLKRAISHPKTDVTGGWNRHYQNAGRIIRHSATGYVEWQQGGNRLSEHHIWHSLTSLLRFYFVKKSQEKL